MENLPGNSHKQAKDDKAERPVKKIESVVNGKIERRKKPLGKRFGEVFVNGDAKSVWAYVVMDVMVPAAKDMVSDAVSQGVERMLFGEVRAGSRRSSFVSNGTKVAYNKFSSGGGLSSQRADPRDLGISRRGRATHNFDEIILDTRAEAENVIDGLFEIVSQYDMASVSDLYGLCGITPNYMDDKWGWTSLREASVSRVRQGYLLNLPRPVQID